MVPHKDVRNTVGASEAGAWRDPQVPLMVPAGTVLRPEGREMVGTESNHQEFLKKFPIQALSESDLDVRFCPAISHPSGLRTVDSMLSFFLLGK